MSAPNRKLPSDLHRDYFFHYLLAAQRALSEQKLKPAMQRYVDAGDYRLGPSFEGQSGSALAIVYDLQGPLVSNSTNIFHTYSQHVRNEGIRNNFNFFSGLFAKMLAAIRSYKKEKEDVSEAFRKTGLDKEDHIDASKAALDEIELTPYSQETVAYARRLGFESQAIDTSDLADIATRIGDRYFGIIASDTRASEAVFGKNNKIVQLKPNVKDDKRENKREILRQMGINPNFSIYIADVDTEIENGKYKISRTDPELPVFSVQGLETRILGLGIAMQKIKREVLRSARKEVSDQTPARSNRYVMLEGEDFMNSVCVLSTHAAYDARLLLEPMIPWQITMYSALAFTPPAHFYAMQRLHEMKGLANRIIQSPSSVQKTEAVGFAKIMEEVNSEFHVTMPAFESDADKLVEEVKEMVSKGRISDSRFRDSVESFDGICRRTLLEYHFDLDKRNLKSMGDIVDMYEDKFRRKS